ncbi:MAG: TauD/TfdA family dioxygenase [Ilumatobacteraceae bacterium]
MKIPTIIATEITEVGLRVTFESHQTPEFYSWRWLQDHSQDRTRYDMVTKQRKVDTFIIDPVVRGVNASIAGESIQVTWSDNSEFGQFPIRLLAEVAGLVVHESPTKPWNSSPSADNLHRATFDEVVSTDEGLSAWLTDVAKFGYGLVGNTPKTRGGVETLARRVGYPRETIFGGLWTLSSDQSDHNDSAYSQSFLEPHTDGTYSSDAPGLQMFCCMEREGDGGESILVDGFAIAEQLRTTDPAAFEVLTHVLVRSHYVEQGVHLSADRPVVRLGHLGNIEQISFNNYDRAPFRLPPDLEIEFYRAYGKFHDLLIDRTRWMIVRLEPGDSLLFDNWRILHGRLAYQGRRVFIGCYHNREDFESRRRVLQKTIDEARV